MEVSLTTTFEREIYYEYCICIIATLQDGFQGQDPRIYRDWETKELPDFILKYE